MNDDPYQQRKQITFEQAEGAEPLPSQGTEQSLPTSPVG